MLCDFELRKVKVFANFYLFILTIQQSCCLGWRIIWPISSIILSQSSFWSSCSNFFDGVLILKIGQKESVWQSKENTVTWCIRKVRCHVSNVTWLITRDSSPALIPFTNYYFHVPIILIGQGVGVVYTVLYSLCSV